MRKAFALVFALMSAVQAQDAPPPGVRITFLPPPLEGTLSAGIYTAEGKLVRVLAREAADKDFIAGLNGFITQWDGKDDAANVAPAGKYFVRGYAVGELEVEGVAFHGNDWLKDESAPRLAEIQDLQLHGEELLVRGLGSDGKTVVTAFISLRDGATRFAATPEEAKPDATAPGWTIERVGDEEPAVFAVVQRAPGGGEILRRLDYERGEPQPQKVLARADSKQICLLERNTSETRVRILSLQEPAKDGDAVSNWAAVFSASIRRPPAPTELAAYLERKAPVNIDPSIRTRLMPNELLQVAPAALQFTVAIDERGSFLRTTDGLPLRRVTDTPNLKWAALSREPDGSVTLFQSDGATVEEYRLRKLNQMMAFDAGDYNWTPPK
jgi:hypothetical protein